MSRRKTRKQTRKQPRKTSRARSSVMGGIKSGVFAMLGRAFTLLRSIMPSGETITAGLAWAWHSRGVRRASGLAGGVLVLGLLSWVMMFNLKTNERYSVDPGRIELAANPSWAKGTLAARLKNEIEEDLRADLSDLEETTVFDNEIMGVVHARLEANPWVRRVVRIERRFPTAAGQASRFHPVLELRTPAVMVVSGADESLEYILIDGDGVVLPLRIKAAAYDDFAEGLTTHLRHVHGVEGAPPGVGEAWSNEQVSAALSMERVIRRAELDRALPIHAIELIGIPSKPDARGRVHYQTDGGVVLIPDPARLPGTRLMWGRPPVHASTLEMSPNDKLAQLKSRLREGDSVANTRIDLRSRG